MRPSRKHGSSPWTLGVPGGKVEPGETAQEALAREIDEELGSRVRVGDTVTTTTHECDFGAVTLTTFWCELISGTPRPTEHAKLRWLAPSALDKLEWAPADLPAVETLRSALLRGSGGTA